MKAPGSAFTPERIVAVCALLIGLAVFAFAFSTGLDYRRAARADGWTLTTAQITNRIDINLMTFHLFAPRERYAEVSYTFSADGAMQAGTAQVPQAPGLTEGASIEIRYDPERPADSMPAATIERDRSAYGAMFLFCLFASAGMLLVARFLWRQGVPLGAR